MKVKEFLKEKLEHFKVFIKEQLELSQIDDKKKDALITSLTEYSNDLNVFTQNILLLVKFDSIDLAVKHFLLSYDIEIDDVKDKVDYDKLTRYLKMFIDLVKK